MIQGKRRAETARSANSLLVTRRSDNGTHPPDS